MHSPRAQADKKAYQFRMKRIVEETPGLSLRQEVVEGLEVGPRGEGLGPRAGGEEEQFNRQANSDSGTRPLPLGPRPCITGVRVRAALSTARGL